MVYVSVGIVVQDIVSKSDRAVVYLNRIVPVYAPFWISMRLRHCVCRSERTGNLRESETLMLSDYKLVISAMTSVSAWTMAGFCWLSQAWQDKGAGDRKVEPDICSELLMSCNTILTD